MSTLAQHVAVTLCLIDVIFFSYIPIDLLTSRFALDKPSVFIGLLAATGVATTTAWALRPTWIEWGHGRVVALYGLFAIYALSSYLLDPDHLEGHFTIRTVVAVNPIFMVLAIVCIRHKGYAMRLLLIAAGAYLLLWLAGLHGGSLSLSGGVERSTVAEVYQDSNAHLPYQNVNLYLGLVMVLAVGSALSARTVALTPLAYGVALTSLAAMLSVGGRAAIGAAIFVVILQHSRQHHRNSWAKARHLLAVVVVVTAVVAFSSAITRMVGDTPAGSRFSLLLDGNDSSYRVFLFTSALELFFSSPSVFLFGAGIDYFPVYTGSYSEGGYPHNLILELLAEYGCLGTTLFLLPIGYTLRLRRARLGSLWGEDAAERMVFAVAVYFWAVAVFTGGMRASWVLVFFTYLLLPARTAAPTPNALGNPTQGCDPADQVRPR